jgi:LysR family transcriptional activator of mexEF-oprN operon
MSHTLGTLRLLLGDEVFVRASPSMQPRLRAESLAARVRDVLAQTQEVLFKRHQFDPATSAREFRVGFSNELELLLLPRSPVSRVLIDDAGGSIRCALT